MAAPNLANKKSLILLSLALISDDITNCAREIKGAVPSFFRRSLSIPRSIRSLTSSTGPHQITIKPFEDLSIPQNQRAQGIVFESISHQPTALSYDRFFLHRKWLLDHDLEEKYNIQDSEKYKIDKVVKYKTQYQRYERDHNSNWKPTDLEDGPLKEVGYAAAKNLLFWEDGVYPYGMRPKQNHPVRDNDRKNPPSEIPMTSATYNLKQWLLGAAKEQFKLWADLNPHRGSGSDVDINIESEFSIENNPETKELIIKGLRKDVKNHNLTKFGTSVTPDREYSIKTIYKRQDTAKALYTLNVRINDSLKKAWEDQVRKTSDDTGIESFHRKRGMGIGNTGANKNHKVVSEDDIMDWLNGIANCFQVHTSGFILDVSKSNDGGFKGDWMNSLSKTDLGNVSNKELAFNLIEYESSSGSRFSFWKTSKEWWTFKQPNLKNYTSFESLKNTKDGRNFPFTIDFESLTDSDESPLFRLIVAISDGETIKHVFKVMNKWVNQAYDNREASRDGVFSGGLIGKIGSRRNVPAKERELITRLVREIIITKAIVPDPNASKYLPKDYKETMLSYGSKKKIEASKEDASKKHFESLDKESEAFWENLIDNGMFKGLRIDERSIKPPKAVTIAKALDENPNEFYEFFRPNFKHQKEKLVPEMSKKLMEVADNTLHGLLHSHREDEVVLTDKNWHEIFTTTNEYLNLKTALERWEQNVVHNSLNVKSDNYSESFNYYMSTKEKSSSIKNQLENKNQIDTYVKFIQTQLDYLEIIWCASLLENEPLSKIDAKAETNKQNRESKINAIKSEINQRVRKYPDYMEYLNQQHTWFKAQTGMDPDIADATLNNDESNNFMKNLSFLGWHTSIFPALNKLEENLVLGHGKTYATEVYELEEQQKFMGPVLDIVRKIESQLSENLPTNFVRYRKRELQKVHGSDVLSKEKTKELTQYKTRLKQLVQTELLDQNHKWSESFDYSNGYFQYIATDSRDKSFSPREIITVEIDRVKQFTVKERRQHLIDHETKIDKTNNYGLPNKDSSEESRSRKRIKDDDIDDDDLESNGDENEEEDGENRSRAKNKAKANNKAKAKPTNKAEPEVTPEPKPKTPSQQSMLNPNEKPDETDKENINPDSRGPGGNINIRDGSRDSRRGRNSDGRRSRSGKRTSSKSNNSSSNSNKEKQKKGEWSTGGIVCVVVGVVALVLICLVGGCVFVTMMMSDKKRSKKANSDDIDDMNSIRTNRKLSRRRNASNVYNTGVNAKLNMSRSPRTLSPRDNNGNIAAARASPSQNSTSPKVQVQYRSSMSESQDSEYESDSASESETEATDLSSV